MGKRISVGSIEIFFFSQWKNFRYTKYFVPFYLTNILFKIKIVIAFGKAKLLSKQNHNMGIETSKMILNYFIFIYFMINTSLLTLVRV